MSVLPVGFGSSSGGYEIDHSLRFRASNSAYLSRTPASAGNRRTWTWSGWVKRGALNGAHQTLFNQGGVSTNYTLARFDTSDRLNFESYGAASYNFQKISTAVYRDPSAHMHVVFVLDATNTQARIYVNGTEVVYTTNTNPANADMPFNQALAHSVGATTNPTLYLDGLLSEVYFIDGQALTPSSFGETNSDGVWVPKKYTGTYGTNGFYLDFKDGTSATTLGFNQAEIMKPVHAIGAYSTAVSGSYRVHTFTSGTGSITIPSGVNYEYLVVGGGGGGGGEVATGGNYGGGGGAGGMLSGSGVSTGAALSITVGTGGTGGVARTTPAVAGGNSILGAITAIGGGRGGADVGAATVGGSGGGATAVGTGAAGTAGQGNAGANGQGSYVAAGGGGGAGSAGSGSTGGSGLASSITGSSVTYAAGGSAVTSSGTGASGAANTGNGGQGRGADGSNSGTGGAGGSGVVIVRYLTADASFNDWTPSGISTTLGTTYDWMVDTPTNNYAVLNGLDKSSGITTTQANLACSEGGIACLIRGTTGISSGKWYWENQASASGADMVGVANASASLSNYTGADANGWGYYATNGNKFNAGSSVAYGNSYTTNNIIGVALDMDNGKIWFSKNGIWQASGDPVAGTNAAYSTGITGTLFPTTGCANTGGTQYINFGQRPFSYSPPTGFKSLCTSNLPAVAIANPRKHFDVIPYVGNGGTKSVTGTAFQPDFAWIKSRGYVAEHCLYDVVRGVQQYLSSSTTGAETTLSGLTSFDSGGFTVGSNAGSNNNLGTIVSWLWKANGAGVSNTDGSITSTVSANQTAGFSIVTFAGTGASNPTVGHGLGLTPAMIIAKDRDTNGSNNNWFVYHKDLGAGYFINLNTTSARALISGTSGGAIGTSPSTTTFTLAAGTVDSVNLNETGDRFLAYCFAEIAGYSKFGSYTGNGSTDGPFVFCGFRPRYVLVKRTDVANDWAIFDSARDPSNVARQLISPNSAFAETTQANPIDFVSNGFKPRTADLFINASGGTYIYAAFAEMPTGGINVSPAPAR